jgi:hypothetical protein
VNAKEDAISDVNLTLIRHRGTVVVLGHNNAIRLLLEKAANQARVRNKRPGFDGALQGLGTFWKGWSRSEAGPEGLF